MFIVTHGGGLGTGGLLSAGNARHVGGPGGPRCAWSRQGDSAHQQRPI